MRGEGSLRKGQEDKNEWEEKSKRNEEADWERRVEGRRGKDKDEEETEGRSKKKKRNEYIKKRESGSGKWRRWKWGKRGK